MTPFARVGLFAAGGSVWAGVAALWVFVHPAVAVAFALGGLATAVVATIEAQTVELDTAAKGEKPEARDELATGALRIRPVTEINRDAERARGED